MADLKKNSNEQDPRVGDGWWLCEEAGVGSSKAGFDRRGRSIW